MIGPPPDDSALLIEWYGFLASALLRRFIAGRLGELDLGMRKGEDYLPHRLATLFTAVSSWKDLGIPYKEIISGSLNTSLSLLFMSTNYDCSQQKINKDQK